MPSGNREMQHTKNIEADTLHSKMSNIGLTLRLHVKNLLRFCISAKLQVVRKPCWPKLTKTMPAKTYYVSWPQDGDRITRASYVFLRGNWFAVSNTLHHILRNVSILIKILGWIATGSRNRICNSIRMNCLHYRRRQSTLISPLPVLLWVVRPLETMPRLFPTFPFQKQPAADTAADQLQHQWSPSFIPYAS